jgi:hypothetical protein
LQLIYNWKTKELPCRHPFTCNWFTTRDQPKQNAFVTSLLATDLQLNEELNCTSAILSSSAPIFFTPAEPHRRKRQAGAPQA